MCLLDRSAVIPKEKKSTYGARSGTCEYCTGGRYLNSVETVDITSMGAKSLNALLIFISVILST